MIQIIKTKLLRPVQGLHDESASGHDEAWTSHELTDQKKGRMK